MGLLRKAIETAVEAKAIDVGTSAAAGVSTAVGAAGNAVANGIEKVVENRNLATLKKNSKKQDYCLFVNKETKIGPGIYTVVNKKKEEKYNTLIDGDIRRDFILRLYSKNKGEIANLTKSTTVKKSLFTYEKYTTTIAIHSDIYPSGVINESFKGKHKIYTTDFNDWMITGEFATGNYKIFDKSTGKTIATVSKKYKNASTYLVDCNYDKNEPTILLISIMLDLIS